MEKTVRHAVRTYLIEQSGKVVVIKYKEHNTGFYDIPGGKIEDGETKEEASIREFKEETGITILKQHYIGHNTIEYPERIFEFEIFIVDDYSGEPQEFEENDSMWVDIADIFNEPQIFPSIEVIRWLKTGMNVKLECDTNHKILNVIKLDHERNNKGEGNNA